MHGRKSKRILLHSIEKFKIETFIEEKLKYKIHHSKDSFTRMKYSYYNFFELSKMQLAMLLYKYGDELMYFELRVAVLELLLYYFNLYSQYDNYGPFPERTWIIQSGEIEKCLNDLFILSTEDLKPYMDYIDPKYKVQIQTRFDDDVFKRHHKPKSKEELMTIIKEGMSQAEINGAIQDYWEVGERTARTWMRQFGLTRKYHSRNQDLDDAITTDVSLKESGQTCVSNEQLDVLSQKINEQKSHIINLQAKINELTIENQKLNAENNKYKSAVENLDMLIEQNRVFGMSNASLKKQVAELKEHIKMLTNTPNNS